MEKLVVVTILTLSLFALSVQPVRAGIAPYIDTIVTNTCAATLISCSGLISTSSASLVIVFPTYIFTSCAFQPDNANVTDSQNLSWTKRTVPGFFAGVFNLFEFYAVTSGPVSADNITQTMTAGVCSNLTSGIIIVAINGINLGNPFTQYNLPNPLSLYFNSSILPVWQRSNVNSPATRIVNSGSSPILVLGAYVSNTTAPKTSGGFSLLTSTGPPFTQFVQYTVLAAGSNTVLAFQGGTGPQTWLGEAILLPTGGLPPNSVPFQSVTGPGGLPIPPQLADQNVLGYTFLLAAAIALSSIRLERKKKTDRRLRLG